MFSLENNGRHLLETKQYFNEGFRLLHYNTYLVFYYLFDGIHFPKKQKHMVID